jgi:hypothetical protein
MAEGVSKLKIHRFWGVTLPLPECDEADTERSGGSTSQLNGSGARFDTVWAEPGPTMNRQSAPTLMLARRAAVDPFRPVLTAIRAAANRPKAAGGHWSEQWLVSRRNGRFGGAAVEFWLINTTN